MRYSCFLLRCEFFVWHPEILSPVAKIFRVCTRQFSQTPFSRTATPLRPLGVETYIRRTLSLSLSRFKCMEFEFVSNFFFTVQSTRPPAGRPRNRDLFSEGAREFSSLLSHLGEFWSSLSLISSEYREPFPHG